MRNLYLLLLLFSKLTLFGQVDAYMEEYRITQRSDLNKEKQLLSEATHLPEALHPYLQDSLLHVRQKAYSFVYRKGIEAGASEKDAFIIQLLKGCKDANGSIVGQNLIWLSSFNRSDFSDESRDIIASYLRRSRMPHRKRLVMLAGYAGAGKETMQRQLLEPDLSPGERWYLHLALARMNVKKSIAFCQETTRPLPLNNQLVEYVLPDIIYTRQKGVLNIFIDHMNSDGLHCLSADPDYEEPVICGYRILELIAPVIADFPIGVTAIGGLDTPDYREALQVARQWFRDHPGYRIKTNSY